ncbi:MAG: SLC13 family permease [Proteobacteria bacterium]|nr:MAG: SLC13 family permease [Pseudomonadota bacterium]QKK11978.1 MAG: SLC13 family permease [Pseudomonadota bacterium]
MSGDQIYVFVVLLISLALFAWERWRYDFVAMGAMFAVVAGGVVPAGVALEGFGHPAVITVAAVLIISRALRNSGLIDLIARVLTPFTKNQGMHIAALTGGVAFFSSFMNNVGALALLLPVALETARENKRSPALLLMPLAFGSILGGLITMIGTPPNIIIATYRAELGFAEFAMFDFAPVGLVVTIAGVLFIALYGWRLIPSDCRGKRSEIQEHFQIGEYIIEVRVREGSDLVGTLLSKVDELTEGEAVPIGIVRGRGLFTPASRHPEIRAGDVLVLEADAVGLKTVMDDHGLELAASGAKALEDVGADRLTLCEAVINAESSLVGRDLRYLRRKMGGGVELVALARQGRSIRRRLRDQKFKAGDVLLMQGDEDVVTGMHLDLGLMPLAERDLMLHHPRRVFLAFLIFAAAIAASMAGWIHIAFAFGAAIMAFVFLDILPPRDLYKEVDWPIIVLLGGMMAVGRAMDASGGTQLIADGFVAITSALPAWLTLLPLMVVTIALTNVINNAATAVLMAPIAVGIAQRMEVSMDPFLMTVAVAASCAFLTPVGHQSNTLVMGPGGYRFSDYWRMGLPLTGIVIVTALPMILLFWPL